MNKDFQTFIYCWQKCNKAGTSGYSAVTHILILRPSNCAPGYLTEGNADI